VACTNTIRSYPWRERYLAWAYDNRASVYYDKGEKDLALADFDEASRLDPNDGYAHNGLGNVYKDKGDKQHALAEYQVALRLIAANDRLSQNIGSEIAALQAALANQTNAASLAVVSSPTAADDANRCGLGIGDEQELAACKLAAEYTNRANVDYDKGNNDGALAGYNEAIRLDPKYARAYKFRGDVYREKGDMDRALADYDEAIGLAPEFAKAYTGRGDVYRDKGDKDRALVDYQAALRLTLVSNPSYQDIASKIAALQAVPAIQANAVAKSAPPVRVASPSSYSVATANEPHTAGSESQSHGSVSEIPVQSKGEITVIPVLINNAIALKFIIDSGASDVSIPADVFLTLIRTETIRDTDFIGKRTYQLADGSTVPSERFRIRVLRVGDREIENVTASIADVKASLLLGQSFLNRFKSWSIDNQRHVLLLN